MDDNTNTLFIVIVGVLALCLILVLFQENIGDLIQGALGTPNNYQTH